MPRFNRKRFFDCFRQFVDETVEQEQVDGLEFLLGNMEADPFWKFIPQIAYALATVYHETAGSFQPIEEGFYLGSRTAVRRFQKGLRYYPYFGRGYVQLTWEKNYKRASKIAGVDLVAEPDKALDPRIAYLVMTHGMHLGWFTGKKLDDYILGNEKDYAGARHIINGKDKAGLIAGYARAFEKCLNAAAQAPQAAEESENPSTGQESPGTGQSATTAAVETTTTQAATDGNTTKVTEEKTVATQNVAVEKEEPLGFWATLWKKITGATAAAGGATAITTQAQQAQAFGLSPVFWERIFYIAIGSLLIWMLVEAFRWFWTKWQRRKRTEKLAELNSTPTNTVVIVPPDQLAEYEKQGWIVVRRG